MRQMLPVHGHASYQRRGERQIAGVGVVGGERRCGGGTATSQVSSSARELFQGPVTAEGAGEVRDGSEERKR